MPKFPCKIVCTTILLNQFPNSHITTLHWAFMKINPTSGVCDILFNQISEQISNKIINNKLFLFAHVYYRLIEHTSYKS